ncbi:hypothetical protein BCR41DRAFT_348212 [Lobosporangium transversale]|uniref:Ion transport domain-containing protein n=1 Tax=Lobosporangium transversale TaxID=64571 RepID=A0A1Y2GX52_9FUNG|nr:hypothetical protein BCR41DRAFT_348212 [Lobosporangium transversale]ORZ26394.1 hypothetical protein BCR41DRAFT_348212 [Lobosporangium transversale]|eukprot:XP_021884159.1 hypothetical protein BCR41DRAFT_348212 [Lobosporangium transversale]
MMFIYFFFTTILLLNVLIALMNVAFNVGDETWRLVWTENRLRYVESAENLLYHDPAFLDYFQVRSLFPERIYYMATPQEQKDFYAKAGDIIKEETGGVVNQAQTNEGDKKVEASQVLQLQGKQCQEQKEIISDLRGELIKLLTHMSEMQQQMMDQQRRFDERMEEQRAQLCVVQEHIHNFASRRDDKP